MLVTPLLLAALLSAGQAVDEGVVAVQSTFAGARPARCRLSGFEYAPYAAGASFAGFHPSHPRFREILDASARIETRASETSASAQHELGVLNLVRGDLETSLHALRASAARSPDSARVRNDLACVLTALGVRDEDPRPILEALIEIDSALERLPSSRELLFNRAWVLQMLGLAGAADAAWRRYFEVDAGSPWAIEASRTRTRTAPAGFIWPTEGPTAERDFAHAVPADPQGARVFAMEVLFPSWAERVLRGDESGAALVRSELSVLGTQILEANGERTVADSARAIETIEHDAEETARVARAHRDYAAGLAAQRRFDIERAARHFARAEDGFGEEHPFGKYADLYLAVCDALRDEHARALERLARLAPEAAARDLGFLQGRVAWIQGYSLGNAGRHHEAYEAHEIALGWFERLREAENAATMTLMASQDLEQLGERERSWRYRFKSLSAVGGNLSARRRRTIHWVTSQSALEEGLPEGALYFANEALRLSHVTDNPTYIAETLWWRSAIHAELGDPAQALQDLDAARASAESIPATDLRERIVAGIDMTRGETLLQIDARQSEVLLTRSLERYEGTDFEFFKTRLYLLRARARLARDDVSSAASDLEQAIQEVESQRDRIGDLTFRVSHLDNARSIFEEMVELLVERLDDPTGALSYVELAKARAALDRTGDDGALSLSARELQAALPTRTAIVEYFVTEARLYAWTIGRNQLRFYRIDTPPNELQSLVDDFNSRLGRRDAQFDRVAERAYRVLIEPIVPGLAGADHVVVVPDGPLHSLAFSALRDPASGRYVTEMWGLALAPSASFHATVSSDADTTETPARALVVSDPAFDRKRFPNLPRLPSSTIAGATIAAAYPDAVQLVATEATRTSFFGNFQKRDVIHFGGHAVLNSEDSSTSYLVLASEADRADNGVVYAHELIEHIADSRLVVLAACRTAEGRVSPSEGVVSLASLLQRAGVDTVLASRGDIDDRTSAEFFSAFHRSYASNGDARGALREVQNEFIRNPSARLRHPATWAPFVVLGK